MEFDLLVPVDIFGIVAIPRRIILDRGSGQQWIAEQVGLKGRKDFSAHVVPSRFATFNLPSFTIAAIRYRRPADGDVWRISVIASATLRAESFCTDLGEAFWERMRRYSGDSRL